MFINDKHTTVVSTILANANLAREVAIYAGRKNKDKLVDEWKAKAE